MYNESTGTVDPSEIQRSWELFHQPADKVAYSETARQKRLSMINNYLGFELPSIAATHLKGQDLRGHIENFIGSVEIPMGLAGPLLFHGTHVQGPVLAPLATSEGALVASSCRGAKLLNACGGVTTQYLGSQMTRAPSFTCRSTSEALKLANWVQKNFEILKQQVSEVHAELLKIEPMIHGRSLALEFYFSTADAAGQNMSTIATWDCCQWIVDHAKDAEISIVRYSIESGFSGDKKISHGNFMMGRGARVIAEAWIEEKHLQQIMRVSCQDFISTYLCDIPNYFLNGSVACNSNVANVVAAIFTATGQDIACVHESSLGQLAFELDEKGMYVSLLMPCLVVGSIGGGTSLPAQAEALKLMGCQGAGNKARLAEIITGYCLALELSTISATVEGTFVKAHRQLGRH